MNKYDLTTNTKIVDGFTLYQIKALRDFGNVKAGHMGGWIDDTSTLDHETDSWIDETSKVFAGSSVKAGSTVSNQIITK